MPLDQFSILLDSPSMSYSAGQMIAGRVVINAHEEEKIQGLALTFKGTVTVNYSETHTQSHGGGASSTHQLITRYYNAHENIFEFQTYLLGDGQSDISIQPGESLYPFTLQFPSKDIPSSFVSPHGKVEYVLEADVKRSWKFDYKAQQIIAVNTIVDLNMYPAAALPICIKKTRRFCCWCCTSRPLMLTCNSKIRGYVPGELVEVQVEVDNQSNRTVKDITANIGQTTIFYAQGHKKYSFKIIAAERRGQGVAAGGCDLWTVNLRMPHVPPTKLGGGCRIIDVQYSLNVTLKVSCIARNLSLDCPLIIGTVPLQNTNFELHVTSINTTSALPAITLESQSPPAC